MTQFFKFLLISNNFEKVPLVDISEDQQMLPWTFFHPQIPCFMLVIKFVQDGPKSALEIAKILEHFFCQKPNKKVIDQDTKIETYQTIYVS